MNRREFIAGLGGAAAAWPLAARAQQGGRMRRVGVLMPVDENEPLAKSAISVFTQALVGLGWTDGRNLRMDVRWGGGDANRERALAQELVGLQPDIIVTANTPSTVALQRETRTIPINYAIGRRAFDKPADCGVSRFATTSSHPSPRSCSLRIAAVFRPATTI